MEGHSGGSALTFLDKLGFDVICIGCIVNGGERLDARGEYAHAVLRVPLDVLICGPLRQRLLNQVLHVLSDSVLR